MLFKLVGNNLTDKGVRVLIQFKFNKIKSIELDN